MARIFLLISSLLPVVFLAACNPVKSCNPRNLSGQEKEAYEGYLQQMGSSPSFKLNFELLSIAGSIDGNTTRSVYICPATLEEQQGAKLQISDGMKTYPVVYEKVNDYEYKLGIMVDGEVIYYSR